MRSDDKTPPKGALEEAISLFDELYKLARTTSGNMLDPDSALQAKLADLERRRLSLETSMNRPRPRPRPCICDKCKARLGRLPWYIEAVATGTVMPFDPNQPTIGLLPTGVTSPVKP